MDETSIEDLEGYLRAMYGIQPGSPVGEPDVSREIFVGFTRPQGTDNHEVLDKVEGLLDQHKYRRVDVELSSLIEQAATLWSSLPDFEKSYAPRRGFARTTDLMQWGDFLRQTFGPYTVAVLGVLSIHSRRRSLDGTPYEGSAYFITNLVHPEEVELLRSIYRERFFLVATHQPRIQRIDALERRFSTAGSTRPREEAELVVRIDEGQATSELTEAYGFYVEGPQSALNVNDTFHKADVFVGAQPAEHEDILRRWTDQLFGHPFGTPSRDELGMSLAGTAAFRSSAFGRSVGAALLGTNGSTIAIGWNDTSQPGGGVSTAESSPVLQEHKLNPPVDPSDHLRLDTVWEVLNRLFGSEWADFYSVGGWPPPDEITDAQKSLRDWLTSLRNAAGVELDAEMVGAMPVLRPLTSTRIFNLIEFGRAVHAEMHAITDAARRGVALQDSTLYVTTFPCHECARNIVASGIARVVFVEPYGKSLVSELYKDSICNQTVEPATNDGRVPFEPFLGLSPSRESELFSRVSRKTGLRESAKVGNRDFEGRKVQWNPAGSELRPVFRGSVKRFASHFERAKFLAEEEVIGELLDSIEDLYPEIKTALQSRVN